MMVRCASPTFQLRTTTTTQRMAVKRRLCYISCIANHQQQIQQSRTFASSSSSSNGEDHDQAKKNKRSSSGPVFIKKTPRSAAAAKARPIVNANLNSGGSNGSNNNNINGNGVGIIHGNLGNINGHSNVNDGPSSATTTTTKPVNHHQPHHFVAGGTPCDPSPPPFHLAEYGEESLYTLVLLRHGESEWNVQNRYTGWCDVALTENGRQEAHTAGRLLYENGIEIDQAFTSVLRRASFSCNMALNTAQQHWVPVTKTWRLNERHYGALQGYNKDTAWEELNLDQELVMQMRRAYDVRPPTMMDDHSFWHGNDRRYKKLSHDQMERSRAESLKDTADRIMPFFNSVVVPSLQAGNKCLVVSHANTIRTLIKQIDGISDHDIKGMSIPTGIPLLYRLDKDMRPVDPQIELEFQYMIEPKGYTWGTSHAHGFHGVYLGDLERLQDIQRKRDKTNRAWQRIILRNIGKLVGWDMDDNDKRAFGGAAPPAVETRQLWWQVHSKMQNKADYGNMLLLVKMEDQLEKLMHQHKQKYISKRQYGKMIDQLHLDTEGKVVEPFVALSDQNHRRERERLWYESLVLDLEEECLIK